MRPVFQTRFGKPDGNCFAACIASIFELDFIPEITGAEDEWFEAVNKYLEPFGLWYFEFIIADPENGKLRFDNVPGYSIFTGPGPRGINHAVVAFNGKIVHDPIKDGGGLEKVEACGVFVSLDPSEEHGLTVWSIDACRAALGDVWRALPNPKIRYYSSGFYAAWMFAMDRLGEVRDRLTNRKDNAE